jgi:hypothetical protein
LFVIKGNDAKHFPFALCWRRTTVLFRQVWEQPFLVWEDQDWMSHNRRSKLSILKLGFPEKKLQNKFGVSESTILRRRRSFVSANTNRESHSIIRDNELDILVRGILKVTPRIGYRLVQGDLRRRGLRTQRRRVLESLQRVDPVTVTIRASRSIVRIRYSVPCPNALW